MVAPRRIRGPIVLLGLSLTIIAVTTLLVLWTRSTPTVERPLERMRGMGLPGVTPKENP